MEIFKKLPDIIKIIILSFRPVHPISKILKDKINEIPHANKNDFIFEYKLFLQFLLNIMRDKEGYIYLDDFSFKGRLYIKYLILYDLYKKHNIKYIIQKYHLYFESYYYDKTFYLEKNEIFTLYNINHKDLLFRDYKFNGKIKTNMNYEKYYNYLYNKYSDK